MVPEVFFFFFFHLSTVIGNAMAFFETIMTKNYTRRLKFFILCTNMCLQLKLQSNQINYKHITMITLLKTLT
jgi:hypothetical protein